MLTFFLYKIKTTQIFYFNKNILDTEQDQLKMSVRYSFSLIRIVWVPG